MEHSIELIVGLSFFIIGLSIIFNQKEWIDFIDYVGQKGNWAVMVVGITDLLFGEFIVTFHWVWNGIGTITTIIGSVLFIRGVMRLLFPKCMLGKIYNAKVLMILCGSASVMISSVVLYGWYLNSGCNFDFSKLYAL